MTDTLAILDEVHAIAERLAVIQDKPEIQNSLKLSDLAGTAQDALGALYQAVGQAI